MSPVLGIVTLGHPMYPPYLAQQKDNFHRPELLMVQHGDRQTGSIKPPGFFVSLKCPCPARLPQTAEAGQGRKTGKMNAIGLGPKSCCPFSSFWRRPTCLLVASGLVIQIHKYSPPRATPHSNRSAQKCPVLHLGRAGNWRWTRTCLHIPRPCRGR